MIIHQNITIYQCEYCKKKYFRKCDASKHEPWCKKKPENDHKCFQYCVHLDMKREEYEGGEYERGLTRVVFTCEKTGKKMYSFKAEKRKLLDFMEDDEIRMPTECDLYQDRAEKEIEDFDKQLNYQ